MKWISVTKRLPDDRRPVLAWCVRTSRFLGITASYATVTQFNPPGPDRSGGRGRPGCFDCELDGHRFIARPRVTHWREIEGPKDGEA